MNLTGTTSFTPVAGKAYEMMLELVGNPLNTPADILPAVRLQVYVNSVPTTFLRCSSCDPSPGFDSQVPESSYHHPPPD